jgi:hypothetical protein
MVPFGAIAVCTFLVSTLHVTLAAGAGYIWGSSPADQRTTDIASRKTHVKLERTMHLEDDWSLCPANMLKKRDHGKLAVGQEGTKGDLPP